MTEKVGHGKGAPSEACYILCPSPFLSKSDTLHYLASDAFSQGKVLPMSNSGRSYCSSCSFPHSLASTSLGAKTVSWEMEWSTGPSLCLGQAGPPYSPVPQLVFFTRKGPQGGWSCVLHSQRGCAKGHFVLRMFPAPGQPAFSLQNLGNWDLGSEQLELKKELP